MSMGFSRQEYWSGLLLPSPLKEGRASPSTSPEGPLARGFPGNPERMIVYSTLEYCPSLPGLLGQARIRGGWREAEQQKASVLELVGLVKKRVWRKEEERERERERSIFLRVRGKSIKPLHRAYIAH